MMHSSAKRETASSILVGGSPEPRERAREPYGGQLRRLPRDTPRTGDRMCEGEARATSPPERNAETDRKLKRSTARARSAASAGGERGGGSVPSAAVSFWERRAEGLPLRHWRNPKSGCWRGAPAGSVSPVGIGGHPYEDGIRVARAADPPGEKDELVKVGDGGPALPNGSEGGLVVYVHDDAAPRDELPEGPEAQDDAADLEGVDLGGPF